MNEQEMKDFLIENGDRIAERVREKMVEQIVETYRWQMPDTINQIVVEFMNEKIAPAVREHLQSNEGPILQATIKSVDGITEGLSEAMLEKALENMKGYRFGSLVKAIFE